MNRGFSASSSAADIDLHIVPCGRTPPEAAARRGRCADSGVPATHGDLATSSATLPSLRRSLRATLNSPREIEPLLSTSMMAKRSRGDGDDEVVRREEAECVGEGDRGARVRRPLRGGRDGAEARRGEAEAAAAVPRQGDAHGEEGRREHDVGRAAEARADDEALAAWSQDLVKA